MTVDFDKERFLEEFGQDYGYPTAPRNIDEIRESEFNRLKELVYLDHAGATLYSKSQMEDIFKDFDSNIFGNPHSQNDCSIMTRDFVGDARRQVLNFFNASIGEYSCVFTSGATAALKLVGETFPWSNKSTFMYTLENHNSVLGIREYALKQGAAAIAVDIEMNLNHDQLRNDKSAICIRPHSVQRRSQAQCGTAIASNTYNLFAFPSECNFSGQRINLDLVNNLKENSFEILGSSTHNSERWMVLIDAAKGTATSPPDLSVYKADFVVCSFYKLFGYPSGIGALIIRNEHAKLMKKTYFSGGTVAACIADIDFYKRRNGIEEYFEDGTIPFLSIASLNHGFKILDNLTMSAISRHVTSLATYTRKALLSLKHSNGQSLCILYGLNASELIFDKIGPIVTFNLKRPDGSWFGYREVEKLASLASIQLRTGCFCNPGACAKHLGLSHIDLISNIETGHVCWDDHDILNGKPTGAVRVSYGYMSTFEDAWKFLKFIESSFVSSTRASIMCSSRDRPSHHPVEGADRVFLKSITIYPIKSCAGFSAKSWPLSSTGLLYDREWLLKSLNGEILTQKKAPHMCNITASVNLKMGTLVVESPRCCNKLVIKLVSDTILSDKAEVYSNEIDNWFTSALGWPCTLVRCCGSEIHLCSNSKGNHRICGDLDTKLSFVNEAQFLLISEESVTDLDKRLRTKFQSGACKKVVEVCTARFRPNLVVSGGEPYAEDGWRGFKIGETHFTSLGGCNRCNMINTTSEDGTIQRSNEPLATLASYRRFKGKICFGLLLRWDSDSGQEFWLSVGQELVLDTN